MDGFGRRCRDFWRFVLCVACGATLPQTVCADASRAPSFPPATEHQRSFPLPSRHGGRSRPRLAAASRNCRSPPAISISFRARPSSLASPASRTFPWLSLLTFPEPEKPGASCKTARRAIRTLSNQSQSGPSLTRFPACRCLALERWPVLKGYPAKKRRFTPALGMGFSISRSRL